MLRYDEIQRNVLILADKLPVSEEDKEKLTKGTIEVLTPLISRFERDICFETLLSASAYIASENLGLRLNPLQINEAGGSDSAAWLPLLNRIPLER